MIKFLTTIVAGSLCFLALSKNYACAQSVDITPETVIDVIVESANSRSFETLKNLCNSSSQPASTLICNVSDLDPDVSKALLSSYVTLKKVDNKTEINNDSASIPFTMTADGQTQEGILVLKQQNGKWYLTDVISASDNKPISKSDVEEIKSQDSVDSSIDSTDIKNAEPLPPE
jgi:hypothetical protein